MNQLAMNFDTKRRPQTPYWSTTPLPVSELAAAIARADKQDDAVMAIFRAIGGELGPSQVWKIGTANGMGWVLTSVRRSMSNLADPRCGALVKLRTTRMGLFGAREHLWALPQQVAA